MGSLAPVVIAARQYGVDGEYLFRLVLFDQVEKIPDLPVSNPAFAKVFGGEGRQFM